MKKTIKLLQILFSFSSILLFVSCLNSAGDREESDNRTIIFNGNISLDNSCLNLVDYSVNSAARSAQPSLPASITYYAKAINIDNETDVIFSEDIDQINGSFSIPLKTGAVWRIEVGATGVSAINSSDTDAVLIKDTFDFNPATATEPRIEHTFYLRPYISSTGKGKLYLNLKVENPKDNNIKKIEIVPQHKLNEARSEAEITTVWSSVSNWESEEKSVIFTSQLNATSTVNFFLHADEFKSGIWEVAINFRDGENQLLFSSIQVISVYDNLITEKWESSKTTASSNELIDENGVFKLTTLLIDSYGLTDFYVGGTGANDETGSGSPMKPFATITKAIAVINGINRLDKTYTLHIKDGISQTVDNQIVIQANISIECYTGNSYGNRLGTATITSKSSDCIIKILHSTGSPALTIEGVKQNNSWTGLKLKSASVYNRPTSQTTRGVSITSNASFYMNGGEISGNTITTAGNKGAGVYVETGGYFIMGGGIITSNTSPGLGGGVYVAEGGDFTIKGGSITGNKAVNGGGVYVDGAMTIGGTALISENSTNASPSSSSNIYLPNDKLIKINGDIDGSTIGITTQTAPTIGNNIRFTEGYAYDKEWGQNGTNHPYKYFHSDVSGYSIITDPTQDNPATQDVDENTGDAFLATSGGKIKQKNRVTVYLRIETMTSDVPGKVCYKLGWESTGPLEEPLQDNVTTSVVLKYKGVAVPQDLWEYTQVNGNSIIYGKLYLDSSLPAGKYTVEADFTYVDPTYYPNGLIYAASLEITKE